MSYLLLPVNLDLSNTTIRVPSWYLQYLQDSYEESTAGYPIEKIRYIPAFQTDHNVRMHKPMDSLINNQSSQPTGVICILVSDSFRKKRKKD
jgi:hypothetical protein